MFLADSLPSVGGVPGWLVALAVPFAAAAIGRALVDIVHHVLPWVRAKTGLQVEDTPALDADIESAVKLMLPGGLKLIAAGHTTLPDFVTLLEDTFKAVHPQADVSAVAAHVVANLPPHTLTLTPAPALDSPVPGLDRDPAKS